ncbi:transcription termination/antitermination protein NusG [Cereibacter sphaeroides]|uniref:transcription termination/antitermination protein NusG n=1 Tax=Cereibacter sphaeroides TaxID=1063 RepID=UPI003FCE44CA
MNMPCRNLEAAPRRPWYLVQTKPNAFRIAERNLLRQDIHVFCPTLTVTQRHGARFRNAIRQLFPGYLFIQFNGPAPLWHRVNSTYGVSRLIAFADQPATVPHHLVDGIRQRCDYSGLLAPAETLAPGDRVRVLSGPFANFVATVERLDPQQRVWILLDCIGGTMKVEISRHALQNA